MQKLWVLKRYCIINGCCKINGSKNANQKLVLDRGCKNARSKCANQKFVSKNNFILLFQAKHVPSGMGGGRGRGLLLEGQSKIEEEFTCERGYYMIIKYNDPNNKIKV